MEPERIEKIKQFVPEDSPYFPLYTGHYNSLDKLLVVPAVGEVHPPSFRDALNVLAISTGATSGMLSILAGIESETVLMSHLMHGSGSTRSTQYSDSMHPCTVGRILIRLAGVPNECMKEEIQRRFGKDNVPDNFGRIPVALYDRQSGKLILRGYSGINLVDKADRATRFLKAREMDEPELVWTLNYIAGILAERYDKIVEEDGPLVGISGMNVRRFTRNDFEIHRGKRLREFFKKVDKYLKLVPVYLLPGVLKRESIDDKIKLEEHLARMDSSLEETLLKSSC